MEKTYILIGILFAILLTVVLTAGQTVYGHGKKVHAPKDPEGTVTYSGDIKPIFDSKCSKCHGSKSPVHMEFVRDIRKFKKKMKGPRMNTYTHMLSFIVWPDTGSLMRALDDGSGSESGKAGTMYTRLGATEEERQKNLAVFKEWVGNWTLKDWSEMQKQDIDSMKLAY